MGLLDDYQNISGLLNQELGNYYDTYQQCGQKNKDLMGQIPGLNHLSQAGDAISEVLQTPGADVMMPQVGLTLKQLQVAPKEAFRRLLLGPGRSRDSFIDKFKSFKDYLNQYDTLRGQLPTGNKQTVNNLFETAGKIIKSKDQVGDILRYGDEGFENLIKGSFAGNPTKLKTAVVNIDRKALAGMANKDRNLIELAMGTKNVNIPNTLSHEMVHIRSKELEEYLRRLSEIQNQLNRHVEVTNPRGALLSPERLRYFADPEEVMARGVANEVSGRMGLNYPVSDSWYRHNSWPEELNPMWSEIADKLMSR